jgi:hypothetical protein
VDRRPLLWAFQKWALVMLVSQEIWNKLIARVFHNFSSFPPINVIKLKIEVVQRLSVLMLREYILGTCSDLLLEK